MSGDSLSGSDVFQLLLDRAMRKAGQAGNISRILYRFSSDADLEAVHACLTESKVLKVVNSIQFQKRPFGAPTWITKESDHSNSVILHKNGLDEKAEASLWNEPINESHGLVRMDLYHSSTEQPCLLISMHHVLFDHRGMALFTRLLDEDRLPQKLIQKLSHRSVPTIWKQAFEVAKFSFASSGWGLTSISKPLKRPRSIYRFIQLTKEQTEQLEEQARALGAGISTSVFYVALLMQAFEQLADQHKAKGKFIWMAAPHDMRKKGEDGHLIGNDISFIYFRKERGSGQDLKPLIKDLNQQLLHQIKKKLPQKHADFLRLYRHVPLWAYKAMTDLAHGGKVSSFAFSDLGDTNDHGKFLGANVDDVVYIPPVPLKPGLSIIVSRSKGRTTITLGAIEGVLSSDELQQLANIFGSDGFLRSQNPA